MQPCLLQGLLSPSYGWPGKFGWMNKPTWSLTCHAMDIVLLLFCRAFCRLLKSNLVQVHEFQDCQQQVGKQYHFFPDDEGCVKLSWCECWRHRNIIIFNSASLGGMNARLCTLQGPYCLHECVVASVAEGNHTWLVCYLPSWSLKYYWLYVLFKIGRCLHVAERLGGGALKWLWVGCVSPLVDEELQIGRFSIAGSIIDGWAPWR